MRGISSGTGDRPDHRQPAVAAADPPPSLRRGQRLATQWHRPRLRKHPDHPQHHPGRPRRPPGRPHPAVRGLPDQPGRPDRDHPPKRPIRPRLTARDNQLVSVAKASDPRRPRTAGQGRTAHRLDITSRVRDANKGGEQETSIPRPPSSAPGRPGCRARGPRAGIRPRRESRPGWTAPPRRPASGRAMTRTPAPPARRSPQQTPAERVRRQVASVMARSQPYHHHPPGVVRGESVPPRNRWHALAIQR